MAEYLATFRSKNIFHTKAEKGKFNMTAKVQASNIKLTNPWLKKQSRIFIILQDKLKNIQNEMFYDIIDEYYKKYNGILERVCNYISIVDVAKSNAKTAHKYIYHKCYIK